MHTEDNIQSHLRVKSQHKWNSHGHTENNQVDGKVQDKQIVTTS